MLDFMTIATKPTKEGTEVFPKFKMQKSKAFMLFGMKAGIYGVLMKTMLYILLMLNLIDMYENIVTE